MTAIEDALRVFPADGLMLGRIVDDERRAAAAADVRRRLALPVRHVALGGAPVA